MSVFARRVAMICLATAAMIGCSSQTPPAQKEQESAAKPEATRDACALITAAEAERILGSPVTVTPRSSSSERSVCDYVTKNFETFTLEATWKGAGDEIKTARAAAKTAADAAGGARDQTVADVMGVTRVDKLGDEAYFSRRTMAYVRKGDVLLSFQTAGLNDPAREHWEALAAAALARLAR